MAQDTRKPLETLRQESLKKIKKLREMGVEPYPAGWKRLESRIQNLEVRRKADGEVVTVAGRVMAVREHGSLIFMDLEDESGSIQISFREGSFGDERWKIVNLIDRGDFVGVQGKLYETKTGELTIETEDFEILSKAIRPLPLELLDVETRYRQRYVDLLVNKEVREAFEKRSRIVGQMRQILDKKGFLEVETPILQPLYGGANARPFVTHHHTLDAEMYLRIADELYLKRLIVGGLEKVYEIGHNFRNEGIDTSHNPEFTMMECYQAYADYQDMMDLVEEIYRRIARAVTGSEVVEYQDKKFDFSQTWERLSYTDAPKDEDGGVDESEILGPTFVIDFPLETSPLAKPHRKNPKLVERFEPVIAGMEVGNAYSELNDPVQQRRSFEAQQVAAGEEHPIDEDYITALEYGMPPTGGLGLGIDRMVMILTNQPSIREVILFPTLKPGQ